jgi:hypothetical protein
MIHFSMITARRDIAFHSIEQHDTVIGRIYEEYWYPLLKTSLYVENAGGCERCRAFPEQTDAA